VLKLSDIHIFEPGLCQQFQRLFGVTGRAQSFSAES